MLEDVKGPLENLYNLPKYTPSEKYNGIVYR